MFRGLYILGGGPVGVPYWVGRCEGVGSCFLAELERKWSWRAEGSMAVCRRAPAPRAGLLARGFGFGLAGRQRVRGW